LQEGILDSMGVMELVTYVSTAFDIDIDAQDVTPENFEFDQPTGHYIRRNNPRAAHVSTGFSPCQVARRPGKVALVAGAHRYTYAQIEDMANRLAHALCQAAACNVRPRWRVSPNNWAAVVSIFGVLESWRGVRADQSGRQTDKLQYILNNCRAAALILDDRPASWRCIIRHRDFPAIEREFPAERLPAVNIDLDLACLIYTSGSTGEPKGVMCDHSNITFAASSIIQYLGNTENDIVHQHAAPVLRLRPVSIADDVQVWRHPGPGGFVCLPVYVLNRMEHEGVTGFPGVTDDVWFDAPS